MTHSGLVIGCLLRETPLLDPFPACPFPRALHAQSLVVYFRPLILRLPWNIVATATISLLLASSGFRFRDSRLMFSKRILIRLYVGLQALLRLLEQDQDSVILRHQGRFASSAISGRILSGKLTRPCSAGGSSRPTRNKGALLTSSHPIVSRSRS